MKIYDISQDVLSSEIYPGDPYPKLGTLSSIAKGDTYNLSEFSMCAHNGTHVDAPSHFIKDGKTVGELELSKMIGPCFVATVCGNIGTDEVHALVFSARSENPEAAKRILIRGNGVIFPQGAEALRKEGVVLIGTESQSVGPVDSPMQVHKILLEGDTVLLEGIRLSEVSDGVHFLFAAPLNLGAAEGAPCRAVIVDFY